MVLKNKNIRHVQWINKLTQDLRINIPPGMDVEIGDYFLFEKIDEKTIKMTKIG